MSDSRCAACNRMTARRCLRLMATQRPIAIVPLGQRLSLPTPLSDCACGCGAGRCTALATGQSRARRRRTSSGSAACSASSGAHEALNLYYRFTPSAWGQGYAAEMAHMAVALARQHLPGLPVVALVRPANIPSLRTAERAGLARHPDLDDTEHAVLAQGWDAR